MQDDVALVLGGLELLNANDLQGYFDLLADDVVLMSALVGLHRGKPDVVEAIATACEPLADTHWRRAEKVATMGDSVAVWLHLGGPSRRRGSP